MKSYKEIGGYFELATGENSTGLYHNNALALNTCRNALEYVLQLKNYSHIYFPKYTCEVLLEPIHKLGIAYSFYDIDESFYPQFDFSQIQPGEAFLYTNYFGLCQVQVQHLTSICRNLIVDNAQAFYAPPVDSVPTFYAPRKFFGVPDGTFLYCTERLPETLPIDHSSERLSHLMGRIEDGAQAHYAAFQKNEAALNGQPVKQMSKLTERLLSGIDYKRVAEKRQTNYRTLYEALQSFNRLNLSAITDEVPLCYPLWLQNGRAIKQQLIAQKIYVPTYWPNVRNWSQPGSVAYDWMENLVCLPLDQRYGRKEMEIIITQLHQILNG